MTKIDWKNDKIKTIMEILEKMGCKKRNYEENNIKEKIMKILEKSKKNILPEIHELEVIYNNSAKLDHFDLVRTDQIITIIWNKDETEYQWASACLNKKWKIM